MTKVYILRGLGLGDDENAFENMGAFTSQEKAQALMMSLQAEDEEVGIETEYDIEILDLE